MATGFVPSLDPISNRIGSLLTNTANKRLQERALGGDQSALASLGSRDPNRARSVGGILQQGRDDELLQQEQAKDLSARQQQMLTQVAGGFGQAQDKKGFLAAAANQIRSQFPELAADIDEDVARFDEEQESVLIEYNTANAIFGTQQAIKVGSRKIFANGAILQSTGAGQSTLIDEAGAQHAQGSEGYQESLKSAVQSEIELATGKAQAKSEISIGEAGKKVTSVETAKRREKINDETLKAIRTAPVEIAKLRRLSAVFKKAKTGGSKAFLASLGRTLPGATPENLEDALAATNDFVLAAAGRLSGPVSEKELAFLQEVGPRIANSPEGNALIIGRMIAAFEDDLELAKAQRVWKSKGNDPIDFDVEGFIAEKEAGRDAKFSLDDIPEAVGEPVQVTPAAGQAVGRFTVEVE